jgi:anti-sigma regulatory factor (Ser/Thr protein kinase)
VTANPTPDARTSAEPNACTAVELVEWRWLRRVPPHGMGRPLAASKKPTRPYLSQMWTLPGRSKHAPHAARERVIRTCHEWRVPRQVVDSLELIVSELVTNAVTHAAGDKVTVAVALAGDAVLVVVADRGPRTDFDVRNADDDDENGRGLFLVKALASRYDIRPAGSGTAVMACLDTPRRALPPGGSEDVTHSSRTPTEDDTDVPRSHP